MFLIILIPLTWMHFVWNRCKDPHDEHEGHVPHPRNKLLYFFYQTSVKVNIIYYYSILIISCTYLYYLYVYLYYLIKSLFSVYFNSMQVVWSALLRTILYLVITIMLATCAMFDMIVRIFSNYFFYFSADYFVRMLYEVSFLLCDIRSLK